MKFYEGKHIVKQQKINDTYIETYVVYKDGLIYLQTYVDFVLYSEICIVNLNLGIN